MILSQLSLVNFKNYESASLEFEPGVNVFSGLNGQGKTNLLDAIYYLSNCKSYFNPVDSQNILHGQDFFVVEGVFETGEERDKIYCGVKKGTKKVFKKNKTVYERLAEHVGKFPSVIISPSDKDLIMEGSEMRRKFMDGIISQFDKKYLDQLIQYNRVVKQRNSLLKYFWENRTFDADNLAVWDEQLVHLAQGIHLRRAQFIERFKPIFLSHYQAISGSNEGVDMVYHSHLSEENFEDVLKASLEKDRRSSYSNVGTHKDDIKFQIGGAHPLKKFGSQGQQKTFLIALKLAQFDLIKESTGRVPVLLLDDIFDKIDDVRVAHLMKLVSDHNFGQIFITDTHADRVVKIFEEISDNTKVFHVNGGAVE